MIHLHFSYKIFPEFASIKIADPASTSIVYLFPLAFPIVTTMLQNIVSTVTIAITLLQNIPFTSVTSNFFVLKKRYSNIIPQKIESVLKLYIHIKR